MIVLEATSGMNLPLKVGPMLSLADIAVVTKIDRVSQAEREVFRARIQDVAPRVRIREVNALYAPSKLRAMRRKSDVFIARPSIAPLQTPH